MIITTNKGQGQRLRALLNMFLLVLGILFLPIVTGAIFLIYAFLTSGKKKKYFFLLMFCILSSLVFLDIIPGNGLDLERYMVTTEQMSMVNGVKNWLLFCRTNPSTQYEKTSYLFFALQYFASRFRYINLLSYLSTILTSFFYFFPFIDYTRFKNIRLKWYALVISLISFFMLGYGNIASTIRWGLAVSSCFCIDYMYFYYLKSKKYIILLFLPILFHLGITLAVVLSVYVAFVKKVNIITLLIPIIAVVLYVEFATRGSSSSVLGQLSNMTATYSNGFGEGLSISQGARFVTIMQYLTISLLVIYYLDLRRKADIINRSFDNLGFIFVFILLSFASKNVIFYRYVTIAAPIYSFTILQALQKRKNGLYRSILLSAILICSVLLGFISYRQFDFVFSDVGIIFKNIFAILLNVTT